MLIEPAQLFSPDRHDDFWAIQRELNFTATVYGVGSDVPMTEIMARQSAFFGEHRNDTIIG